MNRNGVEYLLIGGVNFLIRHEPVMTFDIDLWIKDTDENRRSCERALVALDAAWGPTEQEWRQVAEKASGWLDNQPLFCLTSKHGAIDIFKAVLGLEGWDVCRRRAIGGCTAAGVSFFGLADQDMLASQEALDVDVRKQDRIRTLRRALGEK